MGDRRVTNPSRHAVLAERARVADTFTARAVGLLGQKNAGGGLILEPCSSIHTWFMGFAIDVCFLDAENVVLAVYARLRPWRMTRIVRGARRVLELDAGGMGDTAVGDRLEVVPCG